MSNIPVLQNDTDPASRLCEDVRNARIQEGQPVLAARLSCVDHNHRCVGTRDVVPFVDPISLPESWRARGEVIKGLSEPLLREPFGRVRNGDDSAGIVLDGKTSGVGFFLSSMVLEELEVDGLRAVCKCGDVQGEAKRGIETQESERELHGVLQVVSLVKWSLGSQNIYMRLKLPRYCHIVLVM